MFLSIVVADDYNLLELSASDVFYVFAMSYVFAVSYVFVLLGLPSEFVTLRSSPLQLAETGLLMLHIARLEMD